MTTLHSRNRSEYCDISVAHQAAVRELRGTEVRMSVQMGRSLFPPLRWLKNLVPMGTPW
jgi:hypothetical protein